MPDPQTPFGVTSNLAGSWLYQDNQVERVLDNAAYTFAHPDNTLVLAGPPRRMSALKDAEGGFQSMIAIGVLQRVQISQMKSTQPFMSIGSGRTFFLSGKASGQLQMSRFLCNGRNLIRVLYHNAIEVGLNPAEFDDPAVYANASGGNYQFMVNLDSELFLIPMGLAIIFHDKAHNPVGAVYAELCMITSWSVGVAAGQNFIMEDVAIAFDRLLPYDPGSTAVLDGAPGSNAMNQAVFGDSYVGWNAADGSYDVQSGSDVL